MCTTCGCGTAMTDHEKRSFVADPAQARHDAHERIRAHQVHPDEHDHVSLGIDHGCHDHGHWHDGATERGARLGSIHIPGMSGDRLIRLERDILSKNDAFAHANRARLSSAGIFALNLVSSPGSGKTSLLVRSIGDLKLRFPIAVIEGDQQTSNDADRIRATGVPAIQINTGKGCHLDAHMVRHALDQLPLTRDGLLFIENVGNLVCPAAFDLGEAHKVVVLSVTEGEDKPLKYPGLFCEADLMLVNKIDLLPYLDFDLSICAEFALRVNPGIQILTVSARTGEGLSGFYSWIEEHASLVSQTAHV